MCVISSHFNETCSIWDVDGSIMCYRHSVHAARCCNEGICLKVFRYDVKLKGRYRVFQTFNKQTVQTCVCVCVCVCVRAQDGA